MDSFLHLAPMRWDVSPHFGLKCTSLGNLDANLNHQFQQILSSMYSVSHVEMLPAPPIMRWKGHLSATFASKPRKSTLKASKSLLFDFSLKDLAILQSIRRQPTNLKVMRCYPRLSHHFVIIHDNDGRCTPENSANYSLRFSAIVSSNLRQPHVDRLHSCIFQPQLPYL